MVTAEEIVEHRGDRCGRSDVTLLPHFVVDAVVAPCRSDRSRTSAMGRYEADMSHLDDYVQACADEAARRRRRPLPRTNTWTARTPFDEFLQPGSARTRSPSQRAKRGDDRGMTQPPRRTRMIVAAAGC